MISLLSRLKFFAWNCTKGQLIHFRYWKTKKDRLALSRVLDSRETVSYIQQHKCSVARYGDGEFQMMDHGRLGGDATSFNVDSFQPFNPLLSKRLAEVLFTPLENCLVCIPYPMLHSKVYRKHEKTFFEREWLGRGWMLEKAHALHPYLGDSTFTRFYLHRTDIPDYPAYVSALKKIWEGQSVMIVEGEKSRLGVGNDLFDNAKEIRRILCPATDAFSSYERILSTALSLGQKGQLFLLALGHTATVLAYDLAQHGYWAIDLGHVDVEYEWYKMKAKEKCPVPNKYVNEVPEGRNVSAVLLNDLYESQIVARIK